MSRLESLLDEYGRWRDFKILENANKYPGPSGFFAMVAEVTMESHVREVLPADLFSLHERGITYIHKLPFSLYIPYCTGHSVARVLKKGLKTPTIVSRPARHFDTFVDHLTNYLITMQHYFTGAQAASSVEWYAGPFIRSDGLAHRQVKQQIQRLLFNLNYPTRIGLQSPFTNLTITMDAPRGTLESSRAVYAGQDAEPLGAYEEEAKTFLKALVELYHEGDALDQPFTFPIPTLMVTARWLWEDPEIHEAVFRTAAKKGSFYWLNTRVVDPDATYAMCLHRNELMLYRRKGAVDVATAGEVFEKFAAEVESVEPDGATWYRAVDLEVLAFDPETKSTRWRRVKRFLVKRARRGVEVVLSDGRRMVVTHDHPVLVRYKRTNDASLVRASDLLELKAKSAEELRRHQVPVLLASVAGDYVRLVGGGREVVVDESLGYILGHYYASGMTLLSVDDDERILVTGICIFTSNRGTPEGIAKNISKIVIEGSKVGFLPIVWKDKSWRRRRCVILVDGVLTVLLLENDLSPDPEKEPHVPWFIWSSPPSVRLAFIRGFVDARGRITTTSNQRLVEEMMLLMAMTSTSSSIHKHTGERKTINVASDPGDPRVSRHHHQREGDVVWVAIRDVREVEFPEPELFIDVELEDDHYFVHSSGIVTHNCCRISINMNELNHAYNGSKFRTSLRRDLEDLREEYWKTMERRRFGGLWAMPDITGSVNVVDVNLPRIALEARKDESRFWELYDHALRQAKGILGWFRSRYVSIMKSYPSFYAMIVEYMPEFPTFHFNTIGLIGLPEAAAILMAEPRLWRDGSRNDWLRAAELMRRMVEHATETTRRWMSEDGVPWNVEEVPGESASPKLAMLDMREHPELAEYLPDPESPAYSTSIAPYYAPMDLPDRVEVEQRVQKYFTGGVMMHIFLSEEPDPEALAGLTKKLMQTELIYWSYTPAVIYCPRCGKTYTGLHTTCPRCGSGDVEIWSRIVGYYRPLKNWNPPRKREFWLRRHLSVS